MEEFKRQHKALLDQNPKLLCFLIFRAGYMQRLVWRLPRLKLPDYLHPHLKLREGCGENQTPNLVQEV